jgi:hypothetical protein
LGLGLLNFYLNKPYKPVSPAILFGFMGTGVVALLLFLFSAGETEICDEYGFYSRRGYLYGP